MDKLKIIGKSDLCGKINIPGAKNSALPIMVSSLLSCNGLTIKNLPNLEDISSMKKLLKNFNIKSKITKSGIFFDSTNIKNNIADYDLVRKMRASILVLGPLLSRFKEAKISLPGGCAIGTRPIDIHLNGLKKLGVEFSFENGFIYGKIKKKLVGNKVNLSFPSVGATESILMASSLATGTTVINNAAKEPEIIDLANCLNKMGAKIYNAGKKSIIIKGVKKLSNSEHTIISDRIVAGSYIILAIMLNKEFVVNNFDPNLLKFPLKILKKMGANIKIENNLVKIFKSKKIISADIETGPYPGFPTDLQAQMMALMSIANGKSKIKENVFENRFMHVSELNRLGADITIKKDIAIIDGGKNFKGAQVMASDLRASMSLILAALCAKGETTINRVYHLDRGYEKIEEILGKCGPKIYRIK